MNRFQLGYRQANRPPRRRLTIEAAAEWATLAVVVGLLIATGFQSRI